MKNDLLRVYFITHFDNRLTGIAMRNWGCFYDGPPPTAYGVDEADILHQLEISLQDLFVTKKATLDQFLWKDTFSTHQITVDIHPQTVIKKRPVIGKATIPLKLTYAKSKMKSGGYRVVLPRFDWWMILEDASLASEVLKNCISSAMLGKNPRSIYDFRHEGPEYVIPWTPDFLKRGKKYNFDANYDDDNPNLRQVAEDLTLKVKQKKAQEVVGPATNFENHLEPVKRDPPTSLLLVGDPGSGKSTWVRRLAKWFNQQKSKTGREVTIWATSGQRIIAGMIYLGMWQQRCLAILEELQDEGDYLYVNRFVDLLEKQSDGTSIAEFLLPAAQREEISLISECTKAELQSCRRKVPELLKCFTIIRIENTPASKMPALLSFYQHRKNSQIEFTPDSLKLLVWYLDTFCRHESFPGKGFRFIDWFNQKESPKEALKLLPKHITKEYSSFSGLPVKLIADESQSGYSSYDTEKIAAHLRKNIVGQDTACMACARSLTRFKALLHDPEKPVACLFFTGPTGVGKTELAKQLTKFMFGDEKRIIRLDMSEYMTPGSAQRLMAVGRSITSLATQVNSNPLSLILFDEIEKAHPEIMDLLLGVLGEGRMTDSLGRLVDFRMTIIVMTSNLGAGKQKTVGFGNRSTFNFKGEVEKFFRPEFVNRIDEVATFGALEPEHLEKIVDLEIKKISKRTGLQRRKITLTVHKGAKNALARLGYNREMGARPLKRVIEEKVLTPISIQMSATPNLSYKKFQVVAGEKEITMAQQLYPAEDILIIQE